MGHDLDDVTVIKKVKILLLKKKILTSVPDAFGMENYIFEALYITFYFYFSACIIGDFSRLAGPLKIGL